MKYKIVNKKRFMGFVVGVLLFAVMSAFLIFGGTGETKELRSDSEMLELLEQYNLKVVTVKSGDTFWKLQEKELPHEDIRKLYYYASEINEKQMGSLQEQEEIYIFSEK